MDHLLKFSMNKDMINFLYCGKVESLFMKMMDDVLRFVIESFC